MDGPAVGIDVVLREVRARQDRTWTTRPATPAVTWTRTRSSSRQHQGAPSGSPDAGRPSWAGTSPGELADDPHRVAKALQAPLDGMHSVRRGDDRILYRIDGQLVTILDVVAPSRRLQVVISLAAALARAAALDAFEGRRRVLLRR